MVKNLVSVIIPNYNHSKFLKKRIESVLNQTYQNIEIIILDDFSTDSSIDVIEPYRNHSKISNIIYNDSNSGSTFLQWERGISLACGEFIWIAESDDFSSNKFLEKAIVNFQNDSSLIISASRTHHIDNLGNFISINDWGEVLFPDMWETDFSMKGDELIEKMLLYRNVIPNASAVVFKNDLIKEIEILNSNKWFFCGDWFFWSLLLKKGNFAYCHQVLNFQRSNNDTTRAFKQLNLEKKRYEEAISVIMHIASYLNKTIDFRNQNFNWVHDIYINRPSIANKLSYQYWNIEAPFKTIVILLERNLIYHYNLTVFNLKSRLKLFIIKFLQ